MRAAVHTAYGPPAVVRVTDVPTPEITDDELLVAVHATTVNRTDCAHRAAHPFFMRGITGPVRPRVTVLGCEFAGVVQRVGGRVSTFRPGDPVFGYTEGRFGRHAEYLAVAADDSVAHVPAGVRLERAAAATEGAHYALAMIRRAGVTAGDDVLVIGATGAIGSAAVQLIVHRGAAVTAVSPGEHAELVRGLGAGRVLDPADWDRVAAPGSFDAVVDAVGKASFGRARALLRPRGVYTSAELGPLSQNPLLALVTPLLRGRRVVFPIPAHDQEMIRHLAGLLASGAFRPVVDRSFPLQDIVAAYRYVESGRKVGSVVIDVRP
jgi:NADPH:quinone reductase-like Zn-dependent oxidoreductase